MKDYSTSENKFNFILEYQYDGTDIVVFFANKDVWRVANTPQNEEKILRKMKMQVERLSKPKEQKCIKSKKWIKVGTVAGVVAAGTISYFFPSMATYITSLGVGTTFVLCGSLKNAKLNGILRDINKNNFFFTNGQEMNARICKNDIMLTGVSKKARRIIEDSLESGRDPLDFNTINYIDMADLKKIDDNVYNDTSLNFEYTEANKTMKKKK